MEQMDLFLGYLGKQIVTDSHPRETIISSLRQVFDEFLALGRSNRDDRRLSIFLENRLLFSIENTDSLRNAIFSLARDLLSVANVNLLEKGHFAGLFSRQALLSRCFGLGARVGLSDIEIREVLDSHSWFELRIQSAGGLKLECGRLIEAWEVFSTPFSGRRDRWWSCHFLRLYNLYESSDKLPRAMIRVFHVLEKALNMDVGEGDVGEFFESLSQVGRRCCEYEESLKIDIKKLKKTSKKYEVKLRRLVRIMKRVSMEKVAKPDNHRSRMGRKVLTLVKGVGRMGLLQKLHDLIFQGISLGDPLRFALIESVIDASFHLLNKGRLGSLIALADSLEGLKGKRTTQDMTVCAACEFAQSFGVQMLTPGNRLMNEVKLKDRRRFLLMGQVIDSALVLARTDTKIFTVAYSFPELSEGALANTLELFTHCLKSPYQSALLCPATWLLQLKHWDQHGKDIYRSLLSPQFIHNEVSLWLHSKFSPEIAQEIEGFFGFDPTLAKIANRIRHIRVRYKNLTLRSFQYLLDVQRAPEIVFRRHIISWSEWKHGNHYKLVESALTLLSDSLEMLGKKQYCRQVHKVKSDLVRIEKRAYIYSAGRDPNSILQEIARIKHLQNEILNI